jgi:DNA-binding beta-propeller fold protein YncE
MRTGWALMFLGLILAICFVTSAAAGEDAPLYAVINKKPFSVVLIDPEKLQVFASIPLEASPARATWGADYKSIYVMLEEKGTGFFDLNQQGRLGVIDIATRTLVKTIKIGWNPQQPFVSPDRRYLAYYCKGRSGSKKAEAENAAIWLVDTATHELVNVYRSNRSVPDMPYGDNAITGFGACTKNLDSVLLFSQMQREPKKPDDPKPSLYLFARGQSQPLAMLEFNHPIKQLVYSPDQKWLYLLDGGQASDKPEKNRDGKVYVVEVSSGKIIKEISVGSVPRRLEIDEKNNAILLLTQKGPKDEQGLLFHIRDAEISEPTPAGISPLYTRQLEGLSGRVLVSENELHQLSESGAIMGSPVQINKSKSGSQSGPFLDGIPGEMVYSASAHRLIASAVTSTGASTGNLGVIDIDKKQLLNRISTGHMAGQILKGLALAAGAGMVNGYNGATGSYLYTPSPNQITEATRVSNHLELWPDLLGSQVYALNSSTHEAHVIQLSDGSVSKVLKLPKGSNQILSSPDGKILLTGHVYEYKVAEPDSIALIDTQSGKLQEIPVPSGNMQSMVLDENRHRALVFSRNNLMIIDYADGHVLGTISKFDNQFLSSTPLAQ